MMLKLMMPWPPSVNQYWVPKARGRGLTISKAGQDYRKLAAWEIRLQGLAMQRIKGPVAVVMDVMPPNRGKHDLDNLPKGVLDALTNTEVWHDDSQVDDLRLIRGRVVKGGRIKLTITLLSEQRQ